MWEVVNVFINCSQCVRRSKPHTVHFKYLMILFIIYTQKKLVTGGKIIDK